MFRKAEPDVGLVFVPMSGALFYSDVLDGSADVGFYFEGDQALADYGLAVSRAGIVSSYYAVMTDACPPLASSGGPVRFQDLVPFGPAVSGNYDVASHGLGQFARLRLTFTR